MVSTKVV